LRFTGGQFNRDAVIRIKEVATYDRPYVKRAGWLHTESLSKVFYDAIKAFSQREFPTFETREHALGFLVQDYSPSRHQRLEVPRCARDFGPRLPVENFTSLSNSHVLGIPEL